MWVRDMLGHADEPITLEVLGYELGKVAGQVESVAADARDVGAFFRSGC